MGFFALLLFADKHRTGSPGDQGRGQFIVWKVGSFSEDAFQIIIFFLKCSSCKRNYFGFFALLFLEGYKKEEAIR